MILQQVTARASEFQAGRALAFLVAAIPFGLGYVLGLSVKMIKLGVAAFVIGFERGADLGAGK